MIPRLGGLAPTAHFHIALTYDPYSPTLLGTTTALGRLVPFWSPVDDPLLRIARRVSTQTRLRRRAVASSLSDGPISALGAAVCTFYGRAKDAVDICIPMVLVPTSYVAAVRRQRLVEYVRGTQPGRRYWMRGALGVSGSGCVRAVSGGGRFRHSGLF